MLANAVEERQSKQDVIAVAARHLRASRRALAVVLAILGAALEAGLLYLRGQLDTSAQGAQWLHQWCRRILACMGVVSCLEGETVGDTDGFEAIVCNHLSYLDILLIASALPCVMVSKSEVRRWPVIGWLTTHVGSVYVYRGGRRETYPTVNADMARAFRSGVPVAFFPEGTTTDGTTVLPFRRGLFHSVLRDRVVVRTMAIQYELLPNEEDGSIDKDVCWCGDAALIPHLYRLLGLRGVRATLTVGRTVQGRDRFELAENARAAIVDALNGRDCELVADVLEACSL